MKENSNKAFIREYLNDLSGKPKTFDKLRRYIAESDIELVNHIIAFERSFPEYTVTEQDMIEEGEKVAMRCKLKGKGSPEPLFGIPVEDKEIDIQCFIIYFVKDHKIIDHWFQADNLSMLKQLGVIPVNEKLDSSMTHMNVLISSWTANS